MGQSKQQKKLSDTFQGLRTSYPPTEDPHVVGALLKLYLRELPISLMEFELYGIHHLKKKILTFRLFFDYKRDSRRTSKSSDHKSVRHDGTRQSYNFDVPF